MLDLHALTGGGSTSLVNVNTIPSNDGATTAGIPMAAGATLIAWGGITTIADTIAEIKLNSQDLVDNQNGEDYVLGGSASGIFLHMDNLPYVLGQRTINMKQNTAGANAVAFLLDYYPGGPSQGPSPWNGIPSAGATKTGNGMYPTVFSAALTAITYGTVSLSPTNPLPAGKYAILGCWVSSLTNYALIRFLHGDFGPLSPGFPVVDPNVTIARANTPLDILLTKQGHQFTYLSQILGVPCEPIFTVQPGATGLRFQVLDITADTPQVEVNLAKVG